MFVCNHYMNNLPINQNHESWNSVTHVLVFSTARRCQKGERETTAGRETLTRFSIHHTACSWPYLWLGRHSHQGWTSFLLLPEFRHCWEQLWHQDAVDPIQRPWQEFRDFSGNNLVIIANIQIQSHNQGEKTWYMGAQCSSRNTTVSDNGMGFFLRIFPLVASRKRHAHTYKGVWTELSDDYSWAFLLPGRSQLSD